jgi:hypothetical protein
MGSCVRSATSLLFVAALLSIPLSTPLLGQQQDTLGFYRFPAIHGDTIVFAADGVLWEVSAAAIPE